MGGSAGCQPASTAQTSPPHPSSWWPATGGRSWPGLYVRTLVYLWRWTAGMPWPDRGAVDRQLAATNALTTPPTPSAPAFVLELP